MMKHLDLFSGIGGFALAARWVGGIETVQFVEIDSDVQEVIKTISQEFQYMMTSQLSLLLEDNSTSSLPDSLVKTSQLPEMDLDWTENVQGFSTKLSESFASADPVTSSWKTSQPCLLATTGEIWEQYSGSFPRAGTMRNGKLFQRPPLVRITPARGCGLLPTPTASDDRSRIGKGVGKYKNGGFYLQTTKGKSAAYTTSVLDYLKRPDLATSPSFRELMMGYPIGWTKVSGECESKP